MLSAMLVALASAGAPATVDLNDLDHWENTAERFLDGPAGCWEIVGQASWNWDAGRFGMSRGDTVFAARLVDGVWGEFHLEPLGEVVRERRSTSESLLYAYEPRWAPLFGRIEGELQVSNTPMSEALPVDSVHLDPKLDARLERQQERRDAREERRAEKSDEPADEGPVNVLRKALDQISGSASVTSWTQWDDEKKDVVLFRGVPIEGSGKEAEQTIRFPGGGAPNAMDVVFPPSWYTNSFPRVRVTDAQAHLRVRPSGGLLFPTTEAFKADLGILGFKVTGAQTIRYKSIRPCSIPEQGPELPDEPAPSPEESPVEEVPLAEPAE